MQRQHTLQHRHLHASPVRLTYARPTLFHQSVRTDQELLEVPLDSLQSQETGSLGLHPFPERVGARAVDVQLLKHGEGDAVVDQTEGVDLGVGAWILGAELVARKGEDLEARGSLRFRVLSGGGGGVGVGERIFHPEDLSFNGLDGIVEFLEAGELWGEAAFGGGVDDEDDFASVLGERVGFSFA